MKVLLDCRSSHDDTCGCDYALVDLSLQSRNWPFGSAAAIVLILVILFAVTLYLRLGSRAGIQREVSIL